MEQCLLCFWWLPSVCQPSNWWDFTQWSKNWSPRFPKTAFKCRQCLRLWAVINSSSHNTSNIFNRRQIWRIWNPIFWWNVTSNAVSQPGDCGHWCVHEHRPAEPSSIMIDWLLKNSYFTVKSVLVTTWLTAGFTSVFEYFADIVTGNSRSFLRIDLKLYQLSCSNFSPYQNCWTELHLWCTRNWVCHTPSFFFCLIHGRV